jgi:hypothetical protein
MADKWLTKAPKKCIFFIIGILDRKELQLIFDNFQHIKTISGE